MFLYFWLFYYFYLKMIEGPWNKISFTPPETILHFLLLSFNSATDPKAAAFFLLTPKLPERNSNLGVRQCLEKNQHFSHFGIWCMVYGVCYGTFSVYLFPKLDEKNYWIWLKVEGGNIFLLHYSDFTNIAATVSLCIGQLRINRRNWSNWNNLLNSWKSLFKAIS